MGQIPSKESAWTCCSHGDSGLGSFWIASSDDKRKAQPTTKLIARSTIVNLIVAMRGVCLKIPLALWSSHQLGKVPVLILRRLGDFIYLSLIINLAKCLFWSWGELGDFTCFVPWSSSSDESFTVCCDAAIRRVDSMAAFVPPPPPPLCAMDIPARI